MTNKENRINEIIKELMNEIGDGGSLFLLCKHKESSKHFEAKKGNSTTISEMIASSLEHTEETFEIISKAAEMHLGIDNRIGQTNYIENNPLKIN